MHEMSLAEEVLQLIEDAARHGLEEVLAEGGIVPAIDSGWVKQRLVRSQFDRLCRIEIRLAQFDPLQGCRAAFGVGEAFIRNTNS